MPLERLQKILAHHGVASRRHAEELIVAGKVQVNGKTVVELGTKADAFIDDIRVGGKPLKPKFENIYLAFHKPKNCVTTVSDPEGRETVMKFFKKVPTRIYPVGRLDYASEGLLIMTNDGELANAISAARSHVPKVYHVKTNRALSDDQLTSFQNGVPLFGRRTHRARINQIRRGANPWYEVEIIEGRQNQIRLMFQVFGVMVEKLRRVRIGSLSLGDLPPTEWRPLTFKELGALRRDAGLESKSSPRPSKKPVKKKP
ncbi:MAG TPA: pseudouridine synthase [Bryobacteraceae bacterium]|nr:pseudouridine synthase [Bryobacteraceae bacterium]